MKYKIDELTFELFWKKCDADERIALTMINRRHKEIAWRIGWSPSKSSLIRNRVMRRLESMFKIIYNDEMEAKNGKVEE